MNTGQFKNGALALLVTSLLVSCGRARSDSAPALPGHEVARGVRRLGVLSPPRLTESSGLVASRQHGGVFWTHNDGGGRRAVLYAVNRAGRGLAEFPVVGAAITDWEDIAIDDAGHLFVADVGNNDARRTELAVFEVDEPEPRVGGGVALVKRVWRLRFPGAPFDCESLFVWRGHGYLVSKVFNDRRAEIYRFPLTDQKDPCVLEQVAVLRIDSPVTGADISSDGRLLGLVAKAGAFVFQIDGEVTRAAGVKPYHTKFRDGQIEGCCFVPEGLLATSEDRQIFLFTDAPFRPRPADAAGR